ncbi:MAG TPA: EAL domain-containing protein [Gammaproteobacteria bacterium]|nr:EAL domain-containing protein [Gammaproteobacteria bacterium]
MKSLGARFALILAASLFVVMAIAGLWIERQVRVLVDQEAARQAETQAKTILSSLHTLMLNGQGILARDWLDRMQDVEDILEIEILRRDGKEAFTDLTTVEAVNRFRRSVIFERQEVPPRHSGVARGDHFSRALNGETALDLSDAPEKVSIWMPIQTRQECLPCHGYESAPLRGVLRLSVSTGGVVEDLTALRLKLWFLAMGAALFLGLVLWLMLRLSVLRPVDMMSTAMQQISAGEENILLPEERADELGRLARLFRKMRRSLLSREERLKAIMEQSFDGMVVVDENGMIESANPAMERMFGYGPGELVGQSVKVIIPFPTREKHDEYIRNYIRSGKGNVIGRLREEIGCRKDGTTFPIEMSTSEMWIGDQRYFLGIIRDITVKKKRIEALRHQALHDALTGLPNRTLLEDRIEQAISAARRANATVAILYMDLDRFKEINDTLGHHFGDKVLQHVASSVHGVLRESDTLARLGGDEFAILLPGVDEAGAIKIARKVRGVFDEAIQIDEHSLHLEGSIGIVLYPGHGTDVSTLIQHADVAMYVAKERDDGIAVYDMALDHYNVRNLVLMGELRSAIENEALEIHFQPIVNLASGRCVGAEALVRWPHEKHGLMYPDSFIPLAERGGLIQKLGLVVLKKTLTVCAGCRGLSSAMVVAVNLSAKDLQSPDLARRVAETLRQTGIPPQHLKLEITESAIMSDQAQALGILKQLNAMGVRLAIDDFGTGYSSLSYLKSLPVDDIKIDRSFVTDMRSDKSNAVIVKSTIDLAHNMGLRVIAEGVEDRETYDELAVLGCDEAQGYYLSRPLPVPELIEWVETSPWGLLDSS